MPVHPRDYHPDGCEYVLVAHRHNGTSTVLAIYAHLEDARSAAIHQMCPFVSVPAGDWTVIGTEHGYRKVSIHKGAHFPPQRQTTPPEAPADQAGGETE